MRLPILYFPYIGIKKFLNIERKFKSEATIIPIGCDCHPAYVLQSMGLRGYSLPFDWLNMDPLKSFDYVSDCVSNEFVDFMNNLKINERGFYISNNYPFVEFMHEKNLLSIDSQSKFNRRIVRFIDLIVSERVLFICNLPVCAIRDLNDISKYVSSVNFFKNKLANNSSIHIYLRFDNNLMENQLLADELYRKLDDIDVYVSYYVRKLDEYGIWGNKSCYKKLLTDLGINVKMKFPKFFIN
jgi:hypothetical protein